MEDLVVENCIANITKLQIQLDAEERKLFGLLAAGNKISDSNDREERIFFNNVRDLMRGGHIS